MRHRRSVSVEVDIDLEDFDSDDLAEELRERGYTVIGGGSALPPSAAERAYYALNDTIPEPVRAFVIESAGRAS